MSQVEMELVRPDHPWIGEFERDPEVAFDRIVRGVALIPPFGRADALTVIPSLFDPLAPSDPLLSLLDHAARSWIDRWRRKLPEDRVEYGFNRYVRDAVTALRLPQLLSLPETRAMLRREYFVYLRWTEPLVLGTSLDPRAAFWLALAEEQSDLRLESLWGRLCRQTGERLYPAHYLSIGLLGLRRLPVEENERMQRVLGGLAGWAASLPDNERAQRHFLQQVRMLRWLFPLPSRTDWWERVEPLLVAHRQRPFVDWWKEELGQRKAGKVPPPTIAEPDIEEVLQLVRQLRRGSVDPQRSRIEQIIAVREQYAEATGNSYFLVRSASNIASAVLAEAPDLALDLTRRALVWEPNNPFLWNLWGRSLAALGRTPLAEAVFWEARRRFPDNEPSHVELGRLLRGLGRMDEALAVLRGYTHRHRDHPISLNVLGLLLVDANRVDEARPILDRLEALDAHRGTSELSSAIARADAGETVAVPAYEYPIPALDGQEGAEDEEFRELRIDGTVTTADFGLSPGVRPQLPEERQQQLLHDLEAVMTANPDHGYSRLVWFERADAPEEAQQKLLHDFPRLFEVRFVAALRWSDVSALKTLGEEHPDHALLVRFGLIAIDGSDGEDRKRALHWLQRKSSSADDLVGAYIGRAVREHLERTGIVLAEAEPYVLTNHTDALHGIVQEAVRMIGALPAAA